MVRKCYNVYIEKGVFIMEQDLYTRLCEKAKKHNKIYHYTSLESLEAIISNKSLRLSSLKNVNDAYENKRVDLIYKGNIFVFCFTHKYYESYMFWKLYAGKNGVRLAFDSDFFLKHNFDVFTDSECSQKLRWSKVGVSYKKELKVKDITCADVEYTNNFDEYREEYVELKKEYGDDCIMQNGQDFMHTKYAGLVKGIEWSDESETRLRVGLSSFPVITKNRISYPAPYDFLYVPIDDALKTMEVTLNPWHCYCFKERVQNILQSSSITKDCEIKESTMRNQVRR